MKRGAWRLEANFSEMKNEITGRPNRRSPLMQLRWGKWMNFLQLNGWCECYYHCDVCDVWCVMHIASHHAVTWNEKLLFAVYTSIICTHINCRNLFSLPLPEHRIDCRKSIQSVYLDLWCENGVKLAGRSWALEAPTAIEKVEQFFSSAPPLSPLSDDAFDVTASRRRRQIKS